VTYLFVSVVPAVFLEIFDKTLNARFLKKNLKRSET